VAHVSHLRAATVPMRRSGNQEMLIAALRGVVERFGLRGQRVDDVAAGAVMKHSSQWNLTRESVLGCGLAAETPGLDLQRACGYQPGGRQFYWAIRFALGQIDLRNRRRSRHGERSTRGFPQELSATLAAQLSRQDRGPREYARGLDCARRILDLYCRESRNLAPACRWAKVRNSW